MVENHSMITNSSLTIFHKGFDEETRLEKWIRFNYENVWFFGGKGAGINKGYDNANDVQIRIPYSKNIGLDFRNFSIGDIVVKGTIDTDIETQQDLSDYFIYNITSMNNNDFGHHPHIHIGGK